MKPAVEVFGEWALKGKDEGWSVVVPSVAEMLAYAMAKIIPSKNNSPLSILVVGTAGLSANFAIQL